MREGNLETILKTIILKSYNSKEEIQITLEHRFRIYKIKTENGKFIVDLFGKK